MNTKEYQIDDLLIEWGIPFREVLPLLDNVKKLKSFEGRPNIRGQCSQIFGLKATEFNLRAPLEDRPVLQVQYELSSKSDHHDNLYFPYIEQLKKILGKPIKTEVYKHPEVKKEYLWSMVIYSAVWLFDDIKISLSVYGGIRNNDTGPSGAGIFIDWIDEKKAAQPFLKKKRIVEDNINADVNNYTPLKKFKLKRNQKPFIIAHYDLKDPYIAEKDSELRAAQLALYKKELYQTPQYLKKNLENNEIALYYLPKANKTCVSNKWDTILLDSNDENTIVYYEILPARGPGGQRLDVKELSITDSNDSAELNYLLREIEQTTGLKAKIKYHYDD